MGLVLIYLGYLFEGHLTVDPEPPQPQWLVQSNLVNSMASLVGAESSGGLADPNNTAENAANILEELISNLDTIIPEVEFSFLSSFLFIYAWS